MKWGTILELFKDVTFDSEVLMVIETDIDGPISGKKVDFIYEPQGLKTIMQVGDNKIVGLHSKLMAQKMRNL
jgi:hypothetical protein